MNQPAARQKIVVIGGVAGGASAAARARRCDANAEITVLEKGDHVSFANCGLPYHLGGEIAEREKLLVASPELFWDRFRIRICIGHEVTRIDRAARTVTGKRTNGQEFKLPYDKLILATGSEPFRPPFYDTQVENLFQLWTLDDMDRILAYMKKRPCKQATVVGAGFVGLEVVEQLVNRQVKVNLVEMLPQVLGPIDIEMARIVERELIRAGVKLHLDCSVENVLTNSKKATAIKLVNGETLATDLVIVGAGVRPRTQLAQAAGLTIGETGGVRTNEYCQTDDPNVYAVGDMVEYEHGAWGKPMRVPLAGPANRSGRVAGEHAATGQSKPLTPVQGTSIVRVFELAAGVTGLNHRACQSLGLDARSVTIQAAHHASYFPGAKTMTVKLHYDRSGRILGAQAVGAGGVDKRLDVVTSVLHFKGTVDDLAGLDLSYAPPYGAAKDPLHMAAFAAQNDLRGAPELLPHDADLQGMQVVDVRSAGELEKLPAVPDAIHIPVDELSSRYDELETDVPTVVVCHSGKRGHVGACLLAGKGFKQVFNLSGGMSIRRLSN